VRFSQESAVGALCGSLAFAALVLAACSSGQGPTPVLTRPQAVRHATGPKYIYVTDVSQSKLLVYPAGVPNPTPSSTTVPDKPHGVVTDANGYVYVASSESNQIEVYNSGATALEYTIQSSRLDKPQGLALDPAGDLYAANPDNNTIVEFGPGPAPPVIATFVTLASPVGGIAVDSSGGLYADVSDGTVEHCVPLLPSCSTVPGVVGPANTFGGLAFVPGFLAVCGAFEINYYDVPGWMPGRQNVSYYQAGMESRFMTSDSNGTLYIPFAYLGAGHGPAPAVVVVPAGLGGLPLTITAGLSTPFGAAAGP
jgi:hypothetical protein